ncbi:hypothetical protein DHD80_11775 [Gramella sp. AN32]|nr:hypothetical protein [Gramella sp. AN32]
MTEILKISIVTLNWIQGLYYVPKVKKTSLRGNEVTEAIPCKEQQGRDRHAALALMTTHLNIALKVIPNGERNLMIIDNTQFTEILLAHFDSAQCDLLNLEFMYLGIFTDIRIFYSNTF